MWGEKMKKLFCVMLCTLLLFAACGVSDETEVYEDISTNSETVELTFTVNNLYNDMPDIKLIEHAVNEITLQKLNIKITIYPIFGNTKNQFDIALAQNEQIDLFFEPVVTDRINSNQVIAVGELLTQYGQGIIDAVGEEYIRLGEVNGELYGIVSNKDFAVQQGLLMRSDIIEKYDIDISKIYCLEDLTPIFEIVRQNEPEMYCLVNVPGFYLGTDMKEIDSLKTSFAIINDCGNSTEILNKTELPKYEQYLRQLQSWSEKGYIYNSIENASVGIVDMTREGMLFAQFVKYKPGIEVQEKLKTGYDFVCVPFGSAVMRTDTAMSGQWCISSTCKYPDKAMQLLNLMYTDSDLMNLLCWGIEGVHYVVNDDGTITYPEGITAESSGYNSSMNWHLPNQFIAHVWEGNDLDVWEQTRVFNDNAIRSTALGFSFDPSTVQELYDNVKQTWDTYSTGFSKGIFDVDTVLPQFKEAMKNIGIDELIDEIQRQLDSYIELQSHMDN